MGKKTKRRWTDVSKFYNADNEISIKGMMEILEKMREEFGEETNIRFNAGYNNIDMEMDLNSIHIKEEI